jgi:predicted ester cyclase
VCEDKVVVSFTMGGTHTGNYFGLLPTGKTVDGLTGIAVFGIADGKIAEHWSNWDSRSFYEQLGLIPSRQELVERQGQ